MTKLPEVVEGVVEAMRPITEHLQSTYGKMGLALSNSDVFTMNCALASLRRAVSCCDEPSFVCTTCGDSLRVPKESV